MYPGGNNLFYITGYKGSDPNPRYVDNEYLGTHDSPLVPGVNLVKLRWAKSRYDYAWEISGKTIALEHSWPH